MSRMRWWRSWTRTHNWKQLKKVQGLKRRRFLHSNRCAHWCGNAWRGRGIWRSLKWRRFELPLIFGSAWSPSWLISTSGMRFRALPRVQQWVMWCWRTFNGVQSNWVGAWRRLIALRCSVMWRIGSVSRSATS